MFKSSMRLFYNIAIFVIGANIIYILGLANFNVKYRDIKYVNTNVSATSLYNRHVVGYQGWFDCPHNGNSNKWRHWFRSEPIDIKKLSVDMWPDLVDMETYSVCSTRIYNKDGSEAVLFSSADPYVVDKHLSWMKNYNIDGLALQRFVAALDKPDLLVHRNIVLENIRVASSKHERAYFIMYDITGSDPNNWISKIKSDWQYLNDIGITKDAAYWHHRGAPVLAVWGIGFRDRPGAAAETAQLLRELKETPGGLTLLGGVPSGWRSLTDDSKSDLGWKRVYELFDVISPWSVGRYADKESWNKYLQTMKVDADVVAGTNRDYMPVVFPGYSFSNARDGDAKWFNRIPRKCGTFYSMQTQDIAKINSVSMLYTAMFDEFDEGTAIMKILPNSEEIPALANLLTLGQDGCKLSSDFYLQLAGEATKNIHKQ